MVINNAFWMIFQQLFKYAISFFVGVFIVRYLAPERFGILTFILTVSKKSSKLRLKKRKTKNRYDNFAQSFYTKAQKSFIKIAKNKNNYYVFDASLNNRNLENKIFEIICKKIRINHAGI